MDVTTRTILRHEWERRQKSSASYSLRAYARDLGFSVGFLSRVLSGQRLVSSKKIDDLSFRLKWSPTQREIFSLALTCDSNQDPKKKVVLQRQIAKLRDGENYGSLKLDIFAAIADWHHSAILELTSIDGQDITPIAIARVLGISGEQAEMGLDRLKRLFLLKQVDGRWVAAEPRFSTGDVPSLAIRKFHKQLLKKAEQALDGQLPDRRDISGLTMAIDTAKIPVVKDLIKDFRRRLNTLASAGTTNDVYHLGVQFFSLTRR